MGCVDIASYGCVRGTAHVMLLVMVCMAVGLPESVQGDVIAPGSAATAATAATATTQAQHRLPQQLHFHTALSEEASTLANRTVGPCSRVLLMVPSSHSAVDQLRGRFRGKASRLYTLLQKQQEPALLPSNVDSLYGTASTGAEATAASALPGALYPIAASAAVSGALPPQPQQQQQQAPIQNKTQQHLQAPPPQITSRSNAANTTAAAAAAAARDPEDPTKRASWEAEPSYASHYSSTADRPNMCKVTYKQPAAVGTQPYIFSARGYVPYVGTSVVRDSQMLLARLYYSLQYPVKWFVVVSGLQVASGRNAIAYQLKHLQEFPQDKVGLVLITCEYQPAVSEAWNTIFQTFKDEPWGVYMARDTFWEPGALANLSRHGWEAAETGKVELGFFKWSNMGLRDAIHNTFMMTSQGIRRFGLFDENIHPAFCEDLDMMHRAKIMTPPLREHQYLDVLVVHGKRADTQYLSGSGTTVPDDPHIQDEKNHTQFTLERASPNCNYFMRKWGCPSELSGHWMGKTGDCRFRTPFNKTVPHWYWHTNKALRGCDRWLKVDGRPAQLIDSRSKEAYFKVPPHYGEWGGYFEQTRICRLSGFLGRTVMPDGRTMCL